MIAGSSGDSLADFHRVKALFNVLVELKPEEREAALALADVDMATKSKVLVMLADSTIATCCWPSATRVAAWRRT